MNGGVGGADGGGGGGGGGGEDHFRSNSIASLRAKAHEHQASCHIFLFLLNCAKFVNCLFIRNN
jgi:hypothetical protein